MHDQSRTTRQARQSHETDPSSSASRAYIPYGGQAPGVTGEPRCVHTRGQLGCRAFERTWWIPRPGSACRQARGWTRRDLNPWPPGCKPGDLPTDLRARVGRSPGTGAQLGVVRWEASRPRGSRRNLQNARPVGRAIHQSIRDSLTDRRVVKV